MACPDFVVPVKDVKAAVAKVKKAISDAGGSFSGNETGGTFKVNGDGMITGPYTISGSYSVKEKDVTISTSITTTSPKLVTCGAVKEKVMKWLG